nr:immunoglobulin light chain junction region [Macaca mulatta]MOV60978.1 immunoglobulin light chain junction region [Macaca mulatta]MOV60987.1 immunoglobulin light chain junction region [Macaca mulatta]MOV60996.1 immunoglobulin light chain junction region [Macaca mulatta]MOV61020.1 immunoglobulin light chain junction region [Macaca mulatta]
CYQYFSGYSF